MKKNILYALLVGGAMLLGSCENNFDAQIYGKLSTLTFPSTADEYEDYMLSSYLPFQNKWSYTWGDGTNYPWYIPSNGIYHGFDTCTDEEAEWNIAANRQFWTDMTRCYFENLKTITKNSSSGTNHFEKLRDVSRMTRIVGDLEAATTLAETRKKELLGEVRLLRGLMMYYLLHYYGPVPVILDPALIGNTEAENNLVRPTLDEMAGYITDDFLFATENAPETQSEKGRVTADYARFCLMRHYLNEGAHMSGYYEKAYNLYSQFKGNYSLFKSGDNPYIDQFKQANNWNSEVIMALSVDPQATGGNTAGSFNCFMVYSLPKDCAATDGDGNATPFLAGKGWGQYLNVSKQFYDTYEEDDLRKASVITSYYSTSYKCMVTSDDIGSKWSGYILNKYPIEVKNQYQPGNIPLARWADVLLMYAEADVRKSSSVTTNAIDCVNQVRNRAGLDNLPASATASVAAFLDALLAERGHELLFEGCRKIDLIRFNKYYTTMSAFGPSRTPTSQYVPLPDYAVQLAEQVGKKLEQYFTRDDYDGPKK